jgi:hypothetical protein
MQFSSATVKAVKADFSKGEITLTFTVPFDQRESEESRDLSKYCDPDAGDVRLEIYPRQLSMKEMSFSVTAEHSGFKQATESSDSEIIIQAYAICKKSGYASVSALQRELRIGYSRAARIVDSMYESGLVGDVDALGKRKWLGADAMVEASAQTRGEKLVALAEKIGDLSPAGQEVVGAVLNSISEDDDDRDPRRDEEG